MDTPFRVASILRLSAVVFMLSTPSAFTLAGGPGPEPKPDKKLPFKMQGNVLAGPDYATAIQGSFTTGLALVDITGDDAPDMVTTGANDMSPRPLAVYYNKYPHVQEVFDKHPDWYSDDAVYMNGLAVGDVNGDGWMDVAVSLIWARHRHAGSGSVWLFVNRGGKLEGEPSYKAEGLYGSIDCALGDVDADGDLDLVVGVYCPAPGLQPPPYIPNCEDQPAVIFLNRDGRLSRQPSWKTDTPVNAIKPLVADVDQDGWMDVVFSAERLVVFYGGPNHRGDAVPISTRAGWSSSTRHGFPYGVDIGHLGGPGGSRSDVPGGRPLMLAVASFNLGDPATRDGFLAYQPLRDPLGQTAPIWENGESKWTSRVLLADLNNDGYLDLAGDHWGPERETGLPIWFFMGGRHPRGPFGDSPDYKSGESRVGEDLAVADLKLRGVRVLTHTFTATAAAAVLTLPQRRIVAVDRVERNGKRLKREEYAWSPMYNWISLAEPLAPGESVSVSYRWSPVMDLAHATWNPQREDVIYFSQMTVQK